MGTNLKTITWNNDEAEVYFSAFFDNESHELEECGKKAQIF